MSYSDELELTSDGDYTEYPSLEAWEAVGEDLRPKEDKQPEYGNQEVVGV